MSDDTLQAAESLARTIGGLLYGKGPMVQAFVLADLTATWLAGHRADTPDATRGWRAEILSLHCTAIRKLVRLADEEVP